MRARRIVEGQRVVSRVRRDAGHVVVDRLDQLDARHGVIDRRSGQRLGHDHTRSVDAEMELPPASLAPSSVLRGGPFAFAHNREARAIDDEIDRALGWETGQLDREVLAPPRERGVVGRFEVNVHQEQDQPQEAFRLAQGQSEDESERQRRLDRKI